MKIKLIRNLDNLVNRLKNEGNRGAATQLKSMKDDLVDLMLVVQCVADLHPDSSTSELLTRALEKLSK